MLDAAEEMTRPNATRKLHPAATDLSAQVIAAGPAALEAYRAACNQAHFAPAQSPEWVEVWASNSGDDWFIAEIRDESGPILAVAFEIAQSGSFRVARFLSDRHANGNFAPLRRDYTGAVTPTMLKRLSRAIHAARPDIDLLVLERQVHVLDGVENPFLALPHLPSPNVALAVDLKGGFDALLLRASGKRKRKQHRAQTRKFDQVGGATRYAATTPAQTDALLDAFFAMKSVRFAQMGITDVFAPERVRQSFRALFANAAGDETPSFVLHGLEVGGKLRAVTGSSRTTDRIICEFGAIVEDDVSEISPGTFLFYENIEEACESGLAVYDFSVGDEYYKRLWCDLETTQFDTIIALTTKGRLLGTARKAITHAKRIINNDPRLWAMAKWLRKRLSRLTG